MRTISHERTATIAAALASIGTTEQLQAIGVTNGRAASWRTASIDLPHGKYQLAIGVAEGDTPHVTINRVKLTAHSDGTIDVRLVEVTQPGESIVPLGTQATEHECTGRIAPDEVGPLLATQIGLTV